ncbi:MAG: ankyrin repeat domain-containing protein [Candidatus Thiodiazotropha sp. 6PLUC2]
MSSFVGGDGKVVTNSEVEKFLKKLGYEDLLEQNEQGENALHYAVFWNEPNILRALINEGINVNASGEDGFTPLHEAVEQKNENIVTILLEGGADTSIKNDLGERPIDIAKQYNLINIIKVLSKY